MLGNLLTITIRDIFMRGRCALKNFNKFYNYWVGLLLSNVRSGKMITGSTHALRQGNHGGFPPTLFDIESSPEFIGVFVNQ